MQSSLYTLNIKKIKKGEHFTGIGINNVDDRIKLIYVWITESILLVKKIKGQQLQFCCRERKKNMAIQI